MMNFRWNREIIEKTDERIAIRFIGTNYTSVHNVTGLTGTINLTVNICPVHLWVHSIFRFLVKVIKKKSAVLFVYFLYKKSHFA